MVVGTGAVRMSVPIVPAQTIKQVNSTSVVFLVLLLCIFFFFPLKIVLQNATALMAASCRWRLSL